MNPSPILQQLVPRLATLLSRISLLPVGKIDDNKFLSN